MRSFDGSMIYSRKPWKLALTSRTRINQRRHATLGAAFGRADRDIGAAMPDMDVQVDPAGRDEGALGVDARARHRRQPGTGQAWQPCHRHRPGCRSAPVALPAPKPIRLHVGEEGAALPACSPVIYRSFRSLGSSMSRRPSPTICSESTERMMAKPGNSVIQSAWPIYWRPAAIIGAPGRDFGADAQAEEGKPGLGQHGAGKEEGAPAPGSATADCAAHAAS